MSAPRFRLEIFLLALAVILLEISFTRVFSFKLVYYFTYLVIGLAMLGLGSSGIALALSRRLRGIAPERLVGAAGLVTALGAPIAHLVVALVPLNAFEMMDAMVQRPHADVAVAATEALKLFGVAVVLFVPFFAAGLGITTILATQPRHAGRLYFADLSGAALGCATAVPLLTTISPPGAIMLAGAVAAVVAWRGLPGFVRPAVGVVGLALLAAAAFPERLPDPVVESNKTLAPQDPPHDVVFSRWSPVFRVDVLKPTDDFAMGREFHLLVHDGQWGSTIQGWDGEVGSLAHYDAQDRRLPFAVLPPAPRVVIIGSAGGNEILASLRYGARQITAIELNPVTVSLLAGPFAAYTGHLARHPNVELINGEGRSTLIQDPRPADLVWFVAPDSYAAMNAATAGAYVLSESYLYTVEMVVEALRHLTPTGILCFQFGELNFETRPNRTVRFLTTAREALATLGVADPSRHMLLATVPGFGLASSTILLRGTPFTDDEVRRFEAATAALDGARIRWPVTGLDRLHPVAKVASARDDALEAWLASQPFDLRPVRDDAPFFWHFVPFGRALREVVAGPDAEPLALEHGLGELLLATFLLVATVLAALLLLAPLVVHRRRWRAIPHKLAAGTYFAALGLGFMFFEVPLIQHLTLFLGYPTYSLTVTLCGLLVSAGLGALCSERVQRPRRWLAVALAVLAGLALFYRVGLPPLIDASIARPLPIRVTVALAMLMPLGLCLGTFMPLGLRTVAYLAPEAEEELVAWAWAVNGFFSVVASVLATMLAMTWGFRAVMLMALGLYVLGALALTAVVRPATR